MKKAFLYIIPLTLAFIINCHSSTLTNIEETKDGFLPIADCTEGKSIDKFFSKYKLDKINKIVVRVPLDEYPIKLKTLTTITDIEDVTWFCSSLKKVQCMEFCLCDGFYEFWLYEKNKLHLKVTFYTTPTGALVKFYGPEMQPGADSKLGSGSDFYIEDKKLSSWLKKQMDEYHEMVFGNEE